MAKQKEEKAVVETAEGVRKYRVSIDKKATYRADIRDTRGNIVKTFFFIDLSRSWEEEMRDHFERQIETIGRNGVVAKPGDVLELPVPGPDPSLLGGYNETYQLLRAGVIREV